MTDAHNIPTPDAEDAQPNRALTPEMLEEVREALGEGQAGKIIEQVSELHPADTAELLSLIPATERDALMQVLATHFDAEALPYLDEDIRAEVIENLGPQRAAEVLSELEVDDAVHVIEDLDARNQQEILEAIEPETRAELVQGLAYPDESAGRIMQTRFVALPEFWSVGDVIDHLRKAPNLPEDFYQIIVVNPRYHPVGTAMISRIMQKHREVPLSDLMDQDPHTIATDMDQEEVAHLFRRYGLVEAPVVNTAGRLVGVITIDDVVDVIAEEEEEDFMRAGGVMEHDLHAGLADTVRLRFPWLVVNLLTAAMAAWVVSQFETTIERMVTLAVLMPVIASMSGNAGIQSVTVSVRALATRQLQRSNAFAVIRKEMLTNFINGVGLSLLVALAIVLIYRDPQLAFVFSVAATATLTVSGLAGAMIPLALARFKIDPAIASGVFLTTLTDILSFFSFLGLAAWLLR
jgi:magnesium transporter